jgi:paraquat-inducible protein A
MKAGSGEQDQVGGQERASDGVPIVACHECGRLHRLQAVPDGFKATCRRCGGVFYRARPHGIEHALALTFSALVLFAVALASPFMTFDFEGRSQTMTLFTGIEGLYRDGMWPVALTVLLTIVVFPLARLLAGLYVLLPLRLGWQPPAAAYAFRAVRLMAPWAMTEVFILGAIVAYVKLSDLARLEIETGAFALIGAILATAAADAALEPHAVWERLRPQARAPQGAILDESRLLACHSCGQISDAGAVPPGSKLACPRCHASLHTRKPGSVARTWALVLTATILYIPANLLPVMVVIYFGAGQPDTILSGVKELVAADMWPVALLVFFASITVPVLKLCGLVFLLLSVQRGSSWRPRDKTLLYRIVEGVGRWSMVDIFMISILVALVNLGALATIEPRAGALAFAAVVIVTMLASMAFDPRLIWDVAEEKRARRQTTGH